MCGDYRVELNHWKRGVGYSNSEIFDNLDEFMSAEEYVNSLDEDITPEDLDEAINVEVYNEVTNELVSEYWLQREV